MVFHVQDDSSSYPIMEQQDYLRALELFAVINEELGEAQKAFNDKVWKNKGEFALAFIELGQLNSPVEELMSLLSKYLEG